LGRPREVPEAFNLKKLKALAIHRKQVVATVNKSLGNFQRTNTPRERRMRGFGGSFGIRRLLKIFRMGLSDRIADFDAFTVQVEDDEDEESRRNESALLRHTDTARARKCEKR
jgi:hypothetical protein